MKKREEKGHTNKPKADEAGTSGNKPVVKQDQKKTLKFFLTKEESQDSFVSALSSSINSSTDGEEDNEGMAVTSNINLSKPASHPRLYATPRAAKNRTCMEESKEFLLRAVSSHLLQLDSSEQQLFNDINMRLIHSIYLRKINDAKEAIEKGANVNYLFSLESPLLIATEIGDSDMVSYLLTVPKININQKNGYGQTALSVAVRNSFELIVSLLLNLKADVNTQDHLGRTPLHNALFQEKKLMVYRLLAFKANVELEDCFGERAIYTSAVKKPNVACLRALLMEGASTNYQNFSKVPLISRVIMNATHFSIIETLIEFGASVNQADLTLRTPLHFAALANHLPAAKILIENGADIHIKTSHNFTALDVAKSYCSKDVVNYLESLEPRSSVLFLKTIKKDKHHKKKQHFH